MRESPTLRRLAAAALGAAAIFSSVSSAGATTQTVTYEHVTATLTSHETSPLRQNSHLKIFLNGTVVYNAAVTSKWCGTECVPNVIAGARTVVHIVHFEPQGLPSVLLDLYSGGAHCCAIE